MTVSLFSSGIQTGTIGSELFLTNVNEVGRFQLYLQLGNMAAGDFLEVRTYQTILSSGTADPVQFATFQGAQPADALVGYTLPIGNDLQESQSLRYSIKQTLGTARAYNWKVLNLDKFPSNFPVLGIDSLGRVSTVVNLVSGSTGGGASAADIWGYVGGRTLTSPQNWNLIGNISGSLIGDHIGITSGTIFGNLSGTVGAVATVLDKVGYGLANNQVVNFSGTITNVYNVLNPVVPGSVQGTVISSTRDSVNFAPGPSTTDNIYNGSILLFTSGPAAGETRRIVDYVGHARRAVLAGYMTTLPTSGSTAVIVPFADEMIANYGTITGTPTATSIQLDASHAASVSDIYNGMLLVIYDQANPNVEGRIIFSYNGGSKVATVTPGFVHVPTSGDVYEIIVFGRSQVDVPASGTFSADDVWNYTGAKVVDALRSNVGVSGTVVASAVQGLVGVSGTVLASAVQALVGISGTVEAVRGGFVTVSGTVEAVRGGYVTVSGSTSFDPALVWAFTGSRSLNGPQTWNLDGYVGMVTGSVMSVVSGTAASFDPALVWGFTGSRSLNGLQTWNLNGYVGMVTGSVMSVISGTAASFDPALVWAFTGSRSLNGLQNWNLVGNISGTITGLAITVTGVSIDVASVWGYPVRTLTSQIFNLPPIEQGNNLTILRGDTLTWNPTALGSLLNHSKIYFSVKRKYTDLDSEALIKVSDVDGLLVINGTPAGTPANASITINNVNTGDITIVVKAVETAKLDTLQDIYYDVQLVRTDGSVTTLVYGLFTILGDSSRTTS